MNRRGEERDVCALKHLFAHVPCMILCWYVHKCEYVYLKKKIYIFFYSKETSNRSSELF